MNMRFDQRIGDNEYLFREMLKQHRAKMTPRERQKKVKIPREFYPTATERRYAKQARAWFNDMVDFVNFTLDAKLQGWIDEYNGIVKKDAYTNELETFENDYEKEFERVMPESGTKNYITNTGYDVSDYQENQWQKQVAAVLGTSFLVSEPWETEVVKNWANTNYGLFKKLSREHISKINFAVSNGIQTSQSINDIKREVRKINKNISGPRAQLIARDQVGKLRGLLAKRRQNEVGVDMYIWITAGDERVRKTHRSLDGKICQWEDSTVYSEDGIDFRGRTGGMTKAEPGQDVRCFLGETSFVSNILAKKFFRRLYTGEFSKIVMDNGIVFQCTPNHPILTRDRGMIPAKDIEIGEDIVSIPNQGVDSVVDIFPFSKLNAVNGKATFEQCFKFLLSLFPFLEVEGSREQFHGDGSIDANVDIIDIERFLRDSGITGIDKNFFELFFSHADYNLSFLDPDADISKCLFSLGFPSCSFVSFFSKIFSFFNGKSGHPDNVSVGTISNINAIFNNSFFDYGPANIIFFRNSQDAEFSFDIIKNNIILRNIFLVGWSTIVMDQRKASLPDFFRKVVGLDTESFCDFTDVTSSFIHFHSVVDNSIRNLSFHVYNLENDFGQYSITQDNIQVKNCRCNAAPGFQELIDIVDKELSREVA